jgi:hypothetical protein
MKKKIFYQPNGLDIEHIDLNNKQNVLNSDLKVAMIKFSYMLVVLNQKI